MMIVEVQCTEVSQRDRLQGYVIQFSGAWDAWEILPGYHFARRLGTRDSQEEALSLFTLPTISNS